MKKWSILMLVAALAACGSGTNEASDNGAAGSADDSVVRDAFAEAFAGLQVTKVAPAVIDGMYEVEINGRETVHVTADGRFVFTGDLLELRGSEVVNVAESRYEKVRAEGLAELDRDSLISFTADKEKAELFVFTDITCGYCRKLHGHIDEFNKRGVTVHYLAYPRGGLDNEAADALRHIWCAEDQQQAMTDAKLHNKVPNSQLDSCVEAVDQHYAMGSRFGVRGTPAIYNQQGQQLGGYLAPAQMSQRLGL